ncbi:MAG: hypothetical protein R2861_05265 [Desulfobacterales bacterium]
MPKPTGLIILLLDEGTGLLREKVSIPDPVNFPCQASSNSGPQRSRLPSLSSREDGRLPMSDFGDQHRYNVTGLYHDMWGFPSENP